jgi:hypothetical protein
MRRIWFSIGALLLAGGAPAQETPRNVIAAHVRLQGYPCDAPKSAKRDAAASRPDEAVWILVCENARYRVRLVPNMADFIEPF